MAPFQQVGLDFLGAFSLLNARNRWINVGTNYLTRYADTKTSSFATTSKVAAFLIQHIVLRHCATGILDHDVVPRLRFN